MNNLSVTEKSQNFTKLQFETATVLNKTDSVGKLSTFEEYFNPKYLHSSLRNHGYNNYQAISDLIDNSFEENVDSSQVIIEIKHTKKSPSPYEHILVVDDGCGMTFETLKEAIKLGSETGKNSEDDLGCYGVGLNAAAVSMGRCLEIYTKNEMDDFLYVKYDLDEIKDKGFQSIGWRKGTSNEFQFFISKTKSKSGTIIKITKLDRISNKSLEQFKNILKKELGVTYMYFLKEMKKKIFVNDEEVSGIDPMYRERDFVNPLTQNETINYDDKEFKFSVFDMKLKDGVTDQLEFPRNSHHNGIWIYRNLRLVGRALDLDILKREGDGYANSVRIELHITGDSDYLFGSTTTKIITERNKEYIDLGFYQKLSDKIKPYILQIKSEARKKSKKSFDKSLIKNELDPIYEKINKNKFLNLPKWGVNKKNESEDKKSREIPNPDPNRPPKTRKRKELSLKYDVQQCGPMDMFVKFERHQGRIRIIYNSDHNFWDKFLEMDNYGKCFVTEILVGLVYGMEKSGYYHDNPEVEKTFNFFLEMFSEGLRINIAYN